MINKIKTQTEITILSYSPKKGKGEYIEKVSGKICKFNYKQLPNKILPAGTVAYIHNQTGMIEEKKRFTTILKEIFGGKN